ncbi:MAG: acetylglutamate kinase [Bacteroidetes bacterium GWF2_41_61]|nr:MAG: acetylglutamate kinase [Bacteroidetes bacterium GWF2_41_61]OFY91026.1 MAG: acetylglutamate kinase [Bacteroidetes bacterium RIFOXYA12_FULL_40_10]
MKTLTVIKIGGNIIDRPDELEVFLEKFEKIDGPKILVHGGGVLASEMADKLGIKTKMHQGRRITDLETLKLVSMVYAGWINKSIVAKLQKIGCNSIGLSGADADCVPAVRRSPVPVDFGYVGDVDPHQINTGFLLSMLGKGITPVFCAITHDRNGSILNTNADTMASSIAIALSRDYYTCLIYCFEKQGVLSNPDDEESIIPLITRVNYESIKASGVIRDGMIPKMDNAFFAIDNGVSEVFIKHASNLGNNKGTVLK